MNGFILRKFRQVTVLLVLFAAQSLYAQSPSSYLAAYKANNTQKADSVVWKESNNYIFAHLYRDDTDTTNYNFPVTPRLERSIVSYENSSYMKDGCKRVKQSLLQVMRSLTDAQVKMLQGDKPTKTSPIRLWLLLYKGNVVKTLYTLRGGLKKEGFLESFILDVDSKIRDVKFLGFESYGIQCCNINIFISSKEIQDYTGILSDYQTFVENQETLWVLDGVVLKDTKGLTMDMIDCSEPYVPLGKALSLKPDEIDNITVLSGEKAVKKYGTKRGGQVVEIKTKGKNKKLSR